MKNRTFAVEIPSVRNAVVPGELLYRSQFIAASNRCFVICTEHARFEPGYNDSVKNCVLLVYPSYWKIW